MINLDCLKEIKQEATNNARRAELRENKMLLTDDMGDVVDYVIEESRRMRLAHPAFHSEYSFWFSHDNRLYAIVVLPNQVNIRLEEFPNKDDDYSVSDFRDDYEVYYYLDLNTRTVKSIFNNKEYIIEEAN